MKTCCKPYLTALKRAPSLGFNTFRKLVLGALEIRLQNDWSVNVFRSPHASSRLVYKSFKRHLWRRVTNNILTIIPTFWRPYSNSVEDDLKACLERGVNLGSKTFRILVSWTLKIRGRNDGRVNVLSLHTLLEDQSWRLVFKTSSGYIFARWTNTHMYFLFLSKISF